MERSLKFSYYRNRTTSPDTEKMYYNSLTPDRLEASQNYYSSHLVKLHSTDKLKISELARSSYSKIRSSSPLKVKIELNKAKLFRFSIIFKLLNPTFKGKLLIHRSLKAELDPKLSEILVPLLDNLSTTPQGFTYREFCLKMEVLLKYLSDEQKYFLYSPHLYTTSAQLPNRHRYSPQKSSSNRRY